MDHDAELRDPPGIVAPVPDKESWRRGFPADHPGATDGFLSDRAVYLSQCHGWIWYDSLDDFSTQRGNAFDTVEDIHNPEGMNQWLTAYLENAGASVFTVKERDLNTNLALSDDDGDGYSESGSGFTNGNSGFADLGTWAYGENPFSSGGSRRFPAAGGGKATWIPEVPEDGFYAVYVSWDSASDNAQDAHYVITHDGGVIDRWYDQSVHGSTWQYVETLWLEKGVDSLKIELVGDSSQSGRYLSADAVRIGGGMGVIERWGGTTGRPRWEEGAILATQYNGAPTAVYDPYDDGNGSDPSSRSRWADWEHPIGEDAVYVSWHSNACDFCGARGTGVYSYDPTCSSGAPVDGSPELAQALQEEIVDMAQTLWDPDWQDRGTKTDCFSENNPGHNDEMPSALIELAFHDTEADVDFLKDPAFRRDASRAMYRAIVRYYAERDGVTPTFLPEPPASVAVVQDAGGLKVSWKPGPSGWPYGDSADGYVVFTSKDGRSWDNGTAVSGTSTVLSTGEPAVFVRVAATNEGGISFPSEVMGGRHSPDGEAPVLVVAAFDRLDSGLLDWDDLGSGIGEIVKMNVRRMNAYDVAAVHGRSIDAMGWPFDSASDEAAASMDLSRYQAVIWATGEESTVDETFSTSQQAAMRAYVEGGGKLWTTGAEILWDLDYRGSASDKAFSSEVLGALMESDASTSTDVDGEGILAGVALDFGVDDGAAYPVEWPDVLASDRDVIARYGDGGIAGVLGDGVALFGFPFETIADESARDTVTERVLGALLPDYVPPEGEEPGDTDTGGQDTDVTDGDTDDDAITDGGGPGERVRDAGGCGCDSGSWPGALSWPRASSPGFLVLVALLAARRRRGDLA